jgi:cyanophycinase
MSRVMCREAPKVLGTMLNGVTVGKEVDRGLGFLNPAWYVDQHFSARGRLGRALVIMQSHGLKYGIGVDENSALVVEHGSDAELIGYKGAVLIDLSDAASDPAVERFNLKNVKLSYLDRGDKLDMKTLKVTPGPVRLSDTKLDPQSPDFKPYYHDPLFFNDILGHTTASQILGRLIDSSQDHGIGLAFDGLAARGQPTRGFEFKFYRMKDSVGWYTESLGDESYTVLNIHLDIRPIEIIGPLYK